MLGPALRRRLKPVGRANAHLRMPNTTSKRGIRTGCRFEPPPPNPHTLHPQFPPTTNEQALIVPCRSHHNVTAQSYSSTWASIRELAVLCHCHRRAAVKASHSCTVIKVQPTPMGISMAIPCAVFFASCFRWAVSLCALKRPLYHCPERAHTDLP